MPREISIFGVLAPSLLLVFLLAVVIHVGVDWLCGHFGIYKHVCCLLYTSPSPRDS